MKAKVTNFGLLLTLSVGLIISQEVQAQTKSSKGEFGGYGYNYEALKLYTTHGYPATPVFMTFLGNGSTKLAQIAAKGDKDWNFTGGGLLFQTYYNATAYTRMFIRSDGNVGIGTISPTDKLSVNGTIRAKEVRVNTGWADFVFEDNYALPTLSEVERHIALNKHLPGIPSAAEVEAEGVELGVISSKLLQKIEELTLYVIAQEKRIEALEAENRSLKE